MKLIIIVALIAAVLSQNLITDFKAQSAICFAKSKAFYQDANAAVAQTNIDSIIDSLEKLSERVPSVLRACGAEEEAAAYEQNYPPACTKLLAREAKILVKIMKLYAEDQEKN